MKRFYKTAAVARGEQDSTYRIALDGRPIRTPTKAILELQSEAFARAIAAEWNSQGEEIDPRSMPMMAFACTAIDLISKKRDQTVADVLAHAEHDLLCYRAEAPADLAERQNREWQPLLDWAALTLDAPMKVTSGVVSVRQDEQAIQAFGRVVTGLDALALSVLSGAVAASGSLIIGLAMRAGKIDAETAYAAAQLDELYQAERWSEDPDARRRREAIRKDLDAAARAFALLRESA
jgi:chaperone required for assembly of F1-ATPase